MKVDMERSKPDKSEMAARFMAESRLNSALDLYMQILDEKPDDPLCMCNIGYIFFSNKEYDRAEKFLQESLKHDSSLSAANFNLGLLYQEKRQYEKALSFYKDALEKTSRDSEVYLRLGICESRLGREMDARTFWREAIRLRPDNIEAGTKLATSLLENEEFAEAEKVLRVCLVSYPDDVSLHYILGLVLEEQKKIEGAMAQFKKTVTLDDQNAGAFCHLAECCVALEFYKQAEPFFAKAYKLDATLHDAILSLGRLYGRMKKKNDSLIMYRQWVEMVESSIRIASADLQTDYIEVCNLLKKANGGNESQKYSLKIMALEKGQHDQTSVDDTHYQVSLEI